MLDVDVLKVFEQVYDRFELLDKGDPSLKRRRLNPHVLPKSEEFNWDNLNGEQQFSNRLILTEDKEYSGVRVIEYKSGKTLIFATMGEAEGHRTYSCLHNLDGKILLSDLLFATFPPF